MISRRAKVGSFRLESVLGYVRAAVGWALVVDVAWILPLALFGDMSRDELYALIIVLGVTGALIGLCKHGYDRGAPVLTTIFVGILGGGVGVILFLAGMVAWIRLHDGMPLAKNAFVNGQGIGLVIGAGIALWGRFLARGEKVSFGTLGRDMATRLKNAASAVVPLAGGALGLLALWKWGSFETSGFFSWSLIGQAYTVVLIAAAIYCLILVVWGGLFVASALFKRPGRLTDDDLALGRSDVAPENKAAKAARGD